MQVANYGQNSASAFARLTGIPENVVDVFLYIYWKEGVAHNKGQAQFFPAKSPEKFIQAIQPESDLSTACSSLFNVLVTRYGSCPWGIHEPNSAPWYDVINNPILTTKRKLNLLVHPSHEEDPKFDEYFEKTFYDILKKS